MMKEVAKLHIKALPHTMSSRIGVSFLNFLYMVVGKIGFVSTTKRNGKIVAVISGVGKLILTLVVDPEYQNKGIGRALVNERVGPLGVYTEECSRGFYIKLGFREIQRIGRIIFLWRK